jgi:predicted  nucleic acid-binding Zn-ribbon protein
MPNGYNQFPADTNTAMFQEFAQNKQGNSQLSICRKDKLIYYTYIRDLSKLGSYLGMCLVFNGVYCDDTQKIFELFDKAYSDIALKGEIIQLDKNGKISFVAEKFANKQSEIERIQLFFKNNLENHFNGDFSSLPSSFKVGNGSKTVSIKDDNSKILATIREYDCVHVSSIEKSDSELERIHKMLDDLYTENQDLNKKYQKLRGQKKQYKVVMLLSLLVLAAMIGLFAFNSSLKSRDSQINGLNKDLNIKKTTITHLQTNITDLQITQTHLNSEISKLNDTVQLKEDTINEQTTEIEDLNYVIETLNSRVESKNIEISNLQDRNRQLSSDKDLLQKQTQTPRYKVIASQAYCYRLCANTYTKNDCYYSSGAILDVYIQRDGYGLTIGGYIKMSDLSKI